MGLFVSTLSLNPSCVQLLTATCSWLEFHKVPYSSLFFFTALSYMFSASLQFTFVYSF